MVASPTMPIEPPDPTGKILEALTAVQRDLRALAETNPRDLRLLPALSQVAGAVAVLQVPPPTSEPTG
jgi:hypothetical protein